MPRTGTRGTSVSSEPSRSRPGGVVPAPAPSPQLRERESRQNEMRPQSSKPPRWRHVLQAAALVVVVGLFTLFVWKLITDDEGRKLTAAVRAGSEPAAPPFALPVIWAETSTWPPSLRPAA